MSILTYVVLSQTNLFNFSEVVQRVLVQDHLADGAEWELCMRPDLGQIKNVVAELLSLLGRHHLLEIRISKCYGERGHKTVRTTKTSHVGKLPASMSSNMD